MKKLIAQKILEKTKQDYQFLAEEFSRTRQHCWPSFKQLVRPLRLGEKVLDIGCGNGRLAKLLVEKKIDYLGIDNCAPLVKLAQENFLSYSQINFQVGDILQIPVGKNNFDAVFCLAM
ncbi:MAG: class I SAM-dependent methyltransferase, partial [Candidatus Aenigmarchaeota archaeon]|nr:class I SAM-dependent methyltransferase [Candidatus Aenigmarchaeota archaeon]